MKLKGPPIPTPEKVANKNPGSGHGVKSDKRATYDGHLASHPAQIQKTRSKN